MASDRNYLALSSEQVELWLVFVDDIRNDALIAEYETLLTPQEREQQSRFYFAKDRHRYLVTRALVRDVLSRYAPIAPEEWHFEASPHGRPYIANNDDAAKRISFNISHTNGLIVLGVVRDRALGVDTEYLRRNTSLGIADSFFSPRESAMLHKMPPSLQRQRFLELWTLKESYIKARGMGLSIPLDKFSFQLDGDRQIAIDFEADFNDSSSGWRFWQWSPSVDHISALCLEIATDIHATMIVRQVVPLSHERLVDHAMLRTSI